MISIPNLGLVFPEGERRTCGEFNSRKEHTPGHVECPACNELKIMLSQRITPDLPFSEAANLWLSHRTINGLRGSVVSGYIKPNTEDCYEGYIRTLNLFFGSLRLDQIHLGHIRRYQGARLLGDEPFVRYRRPQDAKERRKGNIVIPAKGKTACPVKPEKVNQEMQVLIRLLKLARLWNDEMQEMYQPLITEEADIPRALNPQEQEHWLRVASSRPRWNLIFWYSTAAFETTFGTNEMRGLRLGDVSMAQGIVSVPPKVAKCKRRARTVPLNTAEVAWAFEQLIERARQCGATSPQHYLFPFRNKGYRGEFEGYDPARPMTESGIKKLWEEVRLASGLTWFRMYDTRHTSITRMAEAGVPFSVIEEYAGHVSERMRRHYTHISEQAKRSWGRMAFQRQALPSSRSPYPPAYPAPSQATPGAGTHLARGASPHPPTYVPVYDTH